MFKIKKNIESIFYFNPFFKNMKNFPFSTISPKNFELIEQLKNDKSIKSSIVAEIMSSIDRGDFASSLYAYSDCPQGIGFSATISAPHMHAWALVNKLKS